MKKVSFSNPPTVQEPSMISHNHPHPSPCEQSARNGERASRNALSLNDTIGQTPMVHYRRRTGEMKTAGPQQGFIPLSPVLLPARSEPTQGK